MGRGLQESAKAREMEKETANGTHCATKERRINVIGMILGMAGPSLVSFCQSTRDKNQLTVSSSLCGSDFLPIISSPLLDKHVGICQLGNPTAQESRVPPGRNRRGQNPGVQVSV